MIRTTHNGCKITVKAGRGNDYGRIFATVNGEHFPVVETGSTPEKAVIEITTMLDRVQSTPIDGDRWPASYYAPGTFEMCDSDTHPREVGGTCTHSWCRKNGLR